MSRKGPEPPTRREIVSRRHFTPISFSTAAALSRHLSLTQRDAQHTAQHAGRAPPPLPQPRAPPRFGGPASGRRGLRRPPPAALRGAVGGGGGRPEGGFVRARPAHASARCALVYYIIYYLFIFLFLFIYLYAPVFSNPAGDWLKPRLDALALSAAQSKLLTLYVERAKDAPGGAAAASGGGGNGAGRGGAIRAGGASWEI